MATRPIFYPNLNSEEININSLVKKNNIDFEWFPGFSVTQKQKSIKSLHERALSELPIKNPLEISTKSENTLGIALSAFNLSIRNEEKKTLYTVESTFQSCKVFEGGGPFTDIIKLPSNKAKKDLRLKENGRLKYFLYKGIKWDADNTTAFYDWIYLNFLIRNKNLADEVLLYDAFTDIEFNPEKSLNCQAHSVALFLALSCSGMLQKYLQSEKIFKSLYHPQATYTKIKLP